ncbi:hypothetical protein B0H63DRAFT_521779 [Podospora didyma]|uniref:Uncharacterized protein n=1 Tax=Podospora didyma TaxID=330526 RepID=A0AAE0NU27_9PEZI|nr:hypothetical protein B0H63DRAFT_521779 [Podospora didyma]
MKTTCFPRRPPSWESLVQYAGELSGELWSRKTALRVHRLAQLGSENTKFSALTNVAKAHPLHRLYEDEDRCNDWLVGVVVRPAVIGFRSSDGMNCNQNTGRVWMKAEVSLVENEL